MNPTKMFYFSSEDSEPLDATVYHIHVIEDEYGIPDSIYATAWLVKNKTWITAPLWQFKPIENKLLTEG